MVGRSVYEVGQVGCAVKPYGSGPVSLPKDLDNCLSIQDSLPSEDLLLLEGNHERMRNRDPELVAIKPYFDVVLKRNRRTYVKCIRQRLKLGLVRVTDICISEVGMLFVAKRDGSLRLIMDARPANSLMVKPPHTPLCSSEILPSIESMEATGRSFSEHMPISDVLVYVGMADIDNYFRCIRISESLGHHFTFPGVFSARELMIVGTVVRGAPRLAESQIHICCAALPMGFD